MRAGTIGVTIGCPRQTTSCELPEIQQRSESYNPQKVDKSSASDW